MGLSIRLYEPGHADGHSTKWYWEVLSSHEVMDCGTEDNGQAAYDAAGIAYDKEDDARHEAKMEARRAGELPDWDSLNAAPSQRQFLYRRP